MVNPGRYGRDFGRRVVRGGGEWRWFGDLGRHTTIECRCCRGIALDLLHQNPQPISESSLLPMGPPSSLTSEHNGKTALCGTVHR